MEVTSIAFIPDGNRRYAKIFGLSLAKAYSLGTQKAWDVMEYLQKYPKISVGTFWALSNENLNRTKAELSVLFRIFDNELEKAKKINFFEENKTRVKFIGRLNAFPKKIQAKAFALEKETEVFGKKTINIALGYGGRAEIVDAAKKIAEDYKQNKIKLSEISEEAFEKYLYSSHTPDMIIRTSGTQRLSGFLPYQSAYSELYFCPKYWPEFTEQDLGTAVKDYHNRERRYGK